MMERASAEAQRWEDAWHVQGRARRPECIDYNRWESREQEMKSEMGKGDLITQDLVNLG